MEEIILAQLDFKVGALSENYSKIVSVIKNNNGKLIIFPELALTGYFCEDLFYDQLFLSKINSYLLEISKVCSDFNVSIILGAPFVENKVLYNCAYLINGQEVKIAHKKVFLPNYGVFDERRYFSPGNSFDFVEVNNKKVLFLICEDFWKLELDENKNFQDIDLVVAINASPFENNKANQRYQRSKEIVRYFQASLIYVNLVGGHDSVVFDGASFLCSKDFVIKVAESLVEDVVSLQSLNRLHSNDIKDQSSIKYNVLIRGVRDYFRKNNHSKALIAFSGGIDSALCAAIVIDAIGVENVRLITLPTKFTSDISFKDADHFINEFSVTSHNISIEGVFDNVKNILSDVFVGYKEDVTEENMQSRIRGLIMMSLSNKFNSLLVSTGNKSEYACGYATIYGDMCGAIAPIKDLFKKDVYALARWRNDNIPKLASNKNLKMFSESILNKAPTAELRFNQKDTDSLPDYEILDSFLEQFVEERRPISSISINGLSKSEMKRLVKLIKASEFKRQQSVIGVKVSKSSFDRDWRFPITNGF